MDNIAGTKSSLTWAVHISVAALVLLWIFPTLGLLVSSFRTTDQIRSSGWWAAMFPATQNETFRTADPDETRVDLGEGRFMVEGNLYVVDGRVGSADEVEAEISVWGTSSRAIDAYVPGETADMGDGETMTVQANGDYRWEGDEDQLSGRGQRVFVTAESPPEFTLDNYQNVLFDPANREGMSKAFFNTLTVTIPATIIPILIAAFAAYALAWMEFPGRALLVAAVVALLVVPLQLALIPLLSLHNAIGIGKGYLGVWLAHTGFGLPLAIYLLRNYMVGLPREVIENARVDGATEFQIFTKIILPLSPSPRSPASRSSSSCGRGTTFWWPRSS
jgi:alpha-glucoside transport system permease protein